MRPLLAIATATLLTVGLSGCSPKDLPNLGLAMRDDGVLMGVGYNCDDEDAGFGIYPYWLPSDPSYRGLHYFRRLHRDAHSKGFYEAPLTGTPPAGWTVLPGTEGKLLVELVPDGMYGLSGGSTFGVRFYLRDVTELEPGRVLVGTGYGVTELMTRTQFSDQAKAAC